MAKPSKKPKTDTKVKPRKASVKVGAEFEDDMLAFFDKFFRELEYTIVEIRKQNSGTQNGFDIRVRILDEYDNEKNLFFECKFYETELDWGEITVKVLQLESVRYSIDAFVAISPKVDISNVDDLIFETFCNKCTFPIRLWTPQYQIAELLSLDADLYKKIYKKSIGTIDRAALLKKYKVIIKNLLVAKEFIKNSNTIIIEEAKSAPKESPKLKTNLDTKLNAIVDVSDPMRLQYHQIRCDYKIYLESLQDLNNTLRLRVERWENDLRLKAQRLTNKFNLDDKYTPASFFHDFFETAEQSLVAFFKNDPIDGDLEKLLHGVVFELAAKCPLNWVKNDRTVYTA